MATSSNSADCMCAPVRNRYFYGKLLDVFHFEMEQSYFNEKRWLLNRLISGYGVVCGLNVTLGSDQQSVVVSPGVGIDKCGREIIVCHPSDPFPLPQPTPTPAPPPPPGSANPRPAPVAPATNAVQTNPVPSVPNGDCNDTGVYKHLCICYHECPTDPSPALGGDCDNQSLCTPGSIREKYCLKLCDGKLCAATTTSTLSSMISGGVLNYGMLASYVTNLQCCAPTTDCCIALANIKIPSQGSSYTQQNNIDITIRPLVYTADLLYELMLAWMSPNTAGLKGGK